MGGSEKRKSAGKKAGKTEKTAHANLANQNSSSPTAETLDKIPSNALITDNLHDYLQQNINSEELMLAAEVELPSLPETPCESPAPKQRRCVEKDTTIILSQISDLSRLVQNRSDTLEKLVEKNSQIVNEIKSEVGVNTKQIAELKETIEFICTDVNAMKVGLKKAERCIEEQERRLTLLEGYSRRWNLRIQGIQERSGEDVRLEVIKVCQRLLPQFKEKLSDVVDVAHRLGRNKPGSSTPRGIIFQFTSRFFRDAVWRAAKDADFLKDNKLRISEDLSPADRERRLKLWPAVEKARKENKKAFFVGGRAFVDGVEISPSS